MGSKIDPFDDLGTYKGPTIVACIPVFGRRPLLKHTIQRLVYKNHCKVICTGHDNEDRKVVEKAGAEWIQMPNKPLGRKWNAAFQEAKKYNPDACLFMGSSDFVSDNWLYNLYPLLEKYDLIGTRGCHFADIGQVNRLVYWPGYEGRRYGESIGIGRIISRSVLDQLHFKPFDDRLEQSLDYSMQQRCRSVAARIFTLETENVKSLSISTDQWSNKHSFDDHWSNRLPSKKINEPNEWLQNNFPETLQIFSGLNSNHTTNTEDLQLNQGRELAEG